MVPIENPTEGTVNNTLDRFLASPARICGEVELRIHQYLMGRMDALPDVQRVCSHQQSLAQCRGWLEEYLPGVERVIVSSNAEAHAAHAMKRARRRLRAKLPPRSTT